MGMVDDSDWPESLPLEAELAAAWGAECLLAAVPAGRPVLTIDDVLEQVTDGRARHPQFVINEDNAPLSTARYTTTRVVGGMQVQGYLRLDQVEAALGRGASLQINSLHEYVPAVADMCRAVTERTGLESAAVAFLSPPGRGALTLHQDPVHVVAVQVEGSKRWEVYDHFDGQDAPGPVRKPGAASPAYETVMSPGRALYMPPGRPHRAICEDEWSLHVSIVAIPMTTHALIRKRLEDLLARTPEEEVHTRWGPINPDSVRTAAAALMVGLSATDWRNHEGGTVRPDDSRAQRQSLARLLGK